MKGKTVWIVVASKARARIFSDGTTSTPPVEIYALVDPRSRLHQRDVMADRPGRSYNRLGRGRHAIQERYSLRRDGSKRFAVRICAHLEQALRQRRFEHLVLIASAEFLGLLRREMSPKLRRCIRREIPKNVSTLAVHRVQEFLSKSA